MTYTESDLVIPVLTLLADAGDTGMTTTEIKDILMRQLVLYDDDLEKLDGRNDSHFSQQVRNLVSHKALTRRELAGYEEGRPSGRFWITDKGRQYLESHSGDYNFLLDAGFTDAERKEVIDSDFKDLVIEEGHFIPANQAQKRKRSRKLTQIARTHYSVDGKIWCAGCNFNFDDFYGATAKSYIEIHHLKPIHTYDDDDLEKSLQKALSDVCPLCSNCHRMAHRDSKHLLNPEVLRGLVLDNGKFDIPTR